MAKEDSRMASTLPNRRAVADDPASAAKLAKSQGAGHSRNPAPSGTSEVGARVEASRMTESGDVARTHDGSAVSAVKKQGHVIGKQSLFGDKTTEFTHDPITLGAQFHDMEVSAQEARQIMDQLVGTRDDDAHEKYKKHAIRVFLRVAGAGNLKAVNAFLKFDMHPMARYTAHGGTAFHYAAHKKRPEVLECLVDKLPSVGERTIAMNMKDEWDRTPLHIAAKNGDSDMVKRLVELGSKIEAIDDCGMNSPLTLAARNGHSTACRLLLELGANREYRDRDLKSAYDLMKAKNPNSSVLNQLAPENQKDIDRQDSLMSRERLLEKRKNKLTKSMDYCGAWVSDEEYVLQINLPGLNRNAFNGDHLHYQRIGTGVRLTGSLDVGFTPELAGWSEETLASGKGLNYLNYEHRWETTDFDASFPLPEVLEWYPQYVEIKNGRIGFRFRSAGEYRNNEAQELETKFALGSQSPTKNKKKNSEPDFDPSVNAAALLHPAADSPQHKEGNMAETMSLFKPDGGFTDAPKKRQK